MLTGAFTAIVTPFNQDQSIDFGQLRELINVQVGAGIDGIVPVGTTGESPPPTFDEHHPVLEARFPDGSRVEAIIPPAAPEGPSVAIRRFAKNTLTVDRLVGFGSMSQEAADTLTALVRGKQNIVVAGGTASGKTSMLNAMSGLIPSVERIVTIEDSRELQLQQDRDMNRDRVKY